MQPRYPIFIVSKGRWAQRHTMRALNKMDVPYTVIVEDTEYDRYKAAMAGEYPRNINVELVTLPERYKDAYETCDDLGDLKSLGPGPARNYAWHLAANAWKGALRPKRHWVMDDNIYYFVRAGYNLNAVSETGAIFAAAEDFVDRYENIGIAGFNYVKFCQRKESWPPYILNTRIYSCLLIDNDLPFRWRGRYNEDTDLSLRALKDGYCTINFQAFLADKATTRKVRGGNTAEFYEKEGTLEKSKMLATMHPDVAKVVWRFNRWHHHVDYSAFRKNNKLKLKEGVVIPQGVNNYGMVLEYPEN